MNEKTAFIMYSGGFDSLALAHKLFSEDKYEHYILAINYAIQYPFEMEIIKESAIHLINLFDGFVNKVDVIQVAPFSHIKRNEMIEHDQNREYLLNSHLSVIEYMNYKKNFLGWNKVRALENTKIAKDRINFIDKYKKDDYELNFLEDVFNIPLDLAGKEYNKLVVVKYLLDNNIFEFGITGIRKTGNKVEDLWYEADRKWGETMKALIDLHDIFHTSDYAKIFNAKTMKEVQKIYNERLGR